MPPPASVETGRMHPDDMEAIRQMIQGGGGTKPSGSPDAPTPTAALDPAQANYLNAAAKKKEAGALGITAAANNRPEGPSTEDAWRGIFGPKSSMGQVGISNAPPMTNFLPGDAGTHSLADHVMVQAKPLGAPLTGPNGNAATDAQNFDQTLAWLRSPTAPVPAASSATGATPMPTVPALALPGAPVAPVASVAAPLAPAAPALSPTPSTTPLGGSPMSPFSQPMPQISQPTPSFIPPRAMPNVGTNFTPPNLQVPPALMANGFDTPVVSAPAKAVAKAAPVLPKTAAPAPTSGVFGHPSFADQWRSKPSGVDLGPVYRPPLAGLAKMFEGGPLDGTSFHNWLKSMAPNK